MLVLQRRAEDGILPVGTLTQNRRITIDLVGLGNLTLLGHVIIELGKLAQVQHIETLVLTVHGERAVVGELSLTGLTALGGDQHNTVGTLGTIDGRSRSILQHLHRHDILRVERRKRGDC